MSISLPQAMEEYADKALRGALRSWTGANDEGKLSTAVQSIKDQLLSLAPTLAEAQEHAQAEDEDEDEDRAQAQAQDQAQTESSAHRQALHKALQSILKSFKFMTKKGAVAASTASLGAIEDGTVTVAQVLWNHKQTVATNQRMFNTIVGHHSTLSQLQQQGNQDEMVENPSAAPAATEIRDDDKTCSSSRTSSSSSSARDWKYVIASKEAEGGLDSYSRAAKKMGEKEWVVFGQQWTENLALHFFCRGAVGAQNAYCKASRREYFAKHAVFMPTEEEAALRASLSPLLDDSVGEKLRFLDVGSCYNPHLSQERFDVTALDLKPTHDTVHQCDFLLLKVLPEGSPAEIRCDSDAQSHLDGLPENHYHALSLSLVLNYLPSPAQRLDMLKKARQLLLCPASSDPANPHESGLLLILEKESVLAGKGKRAERALLLLKHWKQAISAIGFELVTYQNLDSGSRRSHAFAFRAVPMQSVSAAIPTAVSDDNAESSSNPSDDVLVGAPGGLYCKLDLEALDLQRSNRNKESTSASTNANADSAPKSKRGQRRATATATAANNNNVDVEGSADNEKRKRLKREG